MYMYVGFSWIRTKHRVMPQLIAHQPFVGLEDVVVKDEPLQNLGLHEHHNACISV